MLTRVLVGLISAAPSLGADDPAVRLAAVQSFAKKQKKPQLSAKDARALADCVELAPVKDTGCAEVAKLCKLHEGDDGSSGTRTESLSLLLSGPESKALRVFWSVGYEPKVSECDPPESMLGQETPDQRAKDAAAFRKAHPREYARCVARAEKDARDDAEELLCDLVLVNACRREAYVRCKARNLHKGVSALEQLHRFDF